MDAKLNHSDLSALLAKQAEISGAKAELFTKAFFDIILEGLEKDGMVKINGLGTFKVTDVASRNSVDVNTGAKIEIKGHKKLTFLPADTLKEKVNQPFAMFEPVEIDENYVDDSDDSVKEEAQAEEMMTPVAEEQEDYSDIGETAAEPVEENINEVVTASDDTKTEETINVVEEKNTIPAAEEECKPDDTVEENSETETDVIKSYPLTEPVNDDEPVKKRKPLIYTLLITVAVLAVLILFFYPQSPKVAKYSNNKHVVKTTTAVTAKPIEEQMSDTVVAVDSVRVAKEEPYKFTMLDELAAKSVGSVGRGDTLLYAANGSITTHTVAADETLTRIALKYYGDKRLWPYIVQHNKLHNPNGLCKGMELLIPRLIPAN